jgi:GNAT superfamily N-acetyltransferase
MNTLVIEPHSSQLSDLQIRPAQADDIPALTAMAELSLRALSEAFYSIEQITSLLRHWNMIDRQVIADGTYYVAQLDGQIVGSGGWSRRRALHTPHDVADGSDAGELIDPRTEAARIRGFFVHPDFAGRGIARRLMRLCEVEARQAGFSGLKLLATLTGVPLYRRCGFVGCALSAERLPDGTLVPLVHMTKRLTNQHLE